jgi:hypothetical protein
VLFFGLTWGFSQNNTFKIAKLKYGGGGDWYCNRTSLPNLIKFINQSSVIKVHEKEDIVEVGSPALFQYAWVHLTGHGNVFFTDAEAQNLRNYLISGGFLHVDDNYGLDKYIRREMKKVFPEHDFVELPFDFGIYKKPFSFPKGLPKVHEHDGKPPQGFGIFHEGRLVCFYSYECDLGNGWEDQEIYNDPETVRQQAFRMGTNIVYWAITQ